MEYGGFAMVKDYELKYLQILAKDFRTVQEVSTELINLTAILNLPKGTEHFLSDIHGEYDTFNHFIKMVLVLLEKRLIYYSQTCLRKTKINLRSLFFIQNK